MKNIINEINEIISGTNYIVSIGSESDIYPSIGMNNKASHFFFDRIDSHEIILDKTLNLIQQADYLRFNSLSSALEALVYIELTANMISVCINGESLLIIKQVLDIFHKLQYKFNMFSLNSESFIYQNWRDASDIFRYILLNGGSCKNIELYCISEQNIKSQNHIINGRSNSEANYQNKVATIISENKSNPIIVSFVIPVLNNLNFTKQCIESIRNTCKKLSYQIIIIDNNSDDGTFEWLQEQLVHNKEIIVIQNETGRNFSESNNQGAKLAIGEYLVFLNNDILVFEDSIQAMIHEFEQDELVGIQGAKLLYPNNTIQHAGIVYGKIPSGRTLHYHIYLESNPYLLCVSKKREFQMLTGAFLCIRKALFEIIEGFDENFIFGHEDLDLCMKARNAGYKVLFNPSIAAYHFESITKKLKGIDHFHRNIDDPNNQDTKNDNYFKSKWKDIIIEDADDYYIADGLIQFVSDKTRLTKYILKIEKLIKDIFFILKEGSYNTASKMSMALFGVEPQFIDPQKSNLLSIDESCISISEQILNDYNIESTEIIIQNQIFQELESNQDGKLKILMTMYGWGESGGGTTLPRAISKKLVELGSNVVVFYAAANSQESKEPYYIEQRIEDGVKLIGIFNRPTIFLDPENPDREVLEPRICSIYEKILDIYQPHIVHFHSFLGLSFSLAEKTKNRNIHSFYTTHNYHLADPQLYMINHLESWGSPDFFKYSELAAKRPDLIDSFKRRFEKARELVNSQVDYTLAVSSRVKDILVDFGTEPNKIAVVNQIHESLNTLINESNLVNQIHRPIRFGYIGAVLPNKGVHLIVQAAQQIPSIHAEFRIYGFINESYKVQMINIDHTNPVSFMGNFTKEDLSRISKDIDIAILPSIWEDCAPIAIIECLAMKLPVICPNIGGFSDFITDNYNGRFFEKGSAFSLAAVINELIANPDKILEMKKNCTVPYNFQDFVEHYMKIYNMIIQNKISNYKDLELNFKK
ncbi:MAG: glycosyltransferase [Candidatus Kapabacteria bacterium]|nr:glycosyltransferase [Candidatus Kapabacteria bacterium]